MTLFDTTGIDLASTSPAPYRRPIAPAVCAPAWSNGTFAIALAALTLIACVAYLRWPLADAIVPWDSKNQFYPMFRFLGDSLRHGTVPLWNPYQFAGYPSAADPQSLLFTPTMLLFAFVAPTASMQVFDAVVFTHLLMGGAGMIGLARRWRWYPTAGVLSALVFMLGGAASSRLEHTGIIISYSFFPLALWSLQAALDRRSVRHALLAGFCATLMAIGRDQVAYLMCIALVGAVAIEAQGADDRLAYLRERAGVLLAAASLTLALMAVPILLALQFVHNSNRPGIAYGMALAGSLDPINLLTLAAPNVFGSLDGLKGYWGPGAGTQAGNDWTDPTINYLFTGTLPLVLLVWHGLAGGRLLERGARSFVVLMGAALIYALGRNTALFGIAFDWLPGVALYRRPADATFVVNIAVAFLAGYLLHRFIEEGSPRFSLLDPPAALLPIFTVVGTAWLIGAGLAFARQAGHFDRSLWSLLAALGLAGLAGLVLLAPRAADQRRLVAILLVAATAGQLLWRNVASALNAEPVALYAANARLSPDQARGLAALRTDIAARQAEGLRPRIEVQGVDGPWQNAAEILKLENVAGYNPLRISAYEHALGVGESTNDPKLRSFPGTFRGYNSRLAQMLGLDYLVLDRPLNALPRYYPRPHASLLYGGNHFYIYRVSGPALPRAYVASQLVPIDSDTSIASGDLPDFDMSQAVLIDRRDLDSTPISKPQEAGAALSKPTSKAAITAYDGNRVGIDVETSHAGVLVLHDIAYPGWVATVDGRPTPILRANLLFRAVRVPAGHHTVEFSFQPFSLTNLAAAARALRRT